jgi:hypothetical protein
MTHPFEEGKTYRNRQGEYVVQAIDGDRMVIKYVDGGTLETSARIQARIWENIHFEEQMVREQEKERLAQEARAARRQSQPKQTRVRPIFGGFQEDDFELKKRGIAWSSRRELGRVLAYDLSQRTQEDFGHWIVPRQSRIHVALDEQYDRDSRDETAAFFVAADERGVTFGFRVGKPGGSEKATWPWSTLLESLANERKTQMALRAAMRDHDLSLDVYAESKGYLREAQILVQDRGFLLQHETEDQEVTRRMNWEELVTYLEEVAPEQRADLFIRKRLPPQEALVPGAAIADRIAEVFEVLLPLYQASLEG